MREEKVREVLGLGDRDQLDEQGVFPPPRADDLAPPIPGQGALAPGVVLGEEWLNEQEMAELFSDDPTISAVLPEGRAKRLDVDPRIVVFEDLPEATATEGDVFPAGGRSLVMDARVGPAALVLPAGDHEVVLLGEQGDLRLFVLRRGDAGDETSHGEQAPDAD